MSAPPKSSGKIVLVATITAAPGKGEEVKKQLAKVRKHAEESEPEAYTYRTVQHSDNSEKFTVFEEYELPKGFEDHVNGEYFQALAKSDIVKDLHIQWAEEFK